MADAPSRARVFHGPNNISGSAGILARAQRDLGWDARSICFSTGSYSFPVDETVPFGVRGRARLLRAAAEFDVFQFYFGESLAGARLTDVPLLGRFGKKVFFYFCGCDLRDSKVVIPSQPVSACAECWPMGCSANRDLAARVAEQADGCFVSTPDLLEFLPGAVLLPQPIDLAAFGQRRDAAFAAAARGSAARDGNVRIAHAPSNRVIKGTRHVERAVQQLRDDGLAVELVLVEGKSYADSLAVYASCDLAVDQLLIGAYGQFAVETMALGKPVVCFIRDDALEAYGPGLPVVSATPSDLASVLRDLIAHRDRWPELGAAGVAYVEAVHGAERVAAIATAEYERAGVTR